MTDLAVAVQRLCARAGVERTSAIMTRLFSALDRDARQEDDERAWLWAEVMTAIESYEPG